eukprot:2862311-Amphidinium_carterae.4
MEERDIVAYQCLFGLLPGYTVSGTPSISKAFLSWLNNNGLHPVVSKFYDKHGAPHHSNFAVKLLTQAMRVTQSGLITSTIPGAATMR